MRFQYEEEAGEYVSSFSTQVEVIEPCELRVKVVQMAKSVIDFYSTKPESG